MLCVKPADPFQSMLRCHAQVMFCLEPAVAGSRPVTLAPGGTWTGTQRISYGPLDA